MNELAISVDDKKRKTENVQQRDKDSQLQSHTRSLGPATDPGCVNGFNQIAADRTDWPWANSSGQERGIIPGGIIEQLIEEARDQITNHELQIKKLQEHMQHLEELQSQLDEDRNNHHST